MRFKKSIIVSLLISSFSLGGDSLNTVSSADVAAGFFFLAVAKLFGPFAYFFAFWG